MYRGDRLWEEREYKHIAALTPHLPIVGDGVYMYMYVRTYMYVCICMNVGCPNASASGPHMYEDESSKCKVSVLPRYIS